MALSAPAAASRSPGVWSSMPLSRRAIHQVAALIAMTGLSSQRSASSASWTMDRLVPHCTIASTSGPLTSWIASRSSASLTWAIETAVGHLRPLIAATSKPSSLEELHDVLVADRLVGRDDADPLGAEEVERALARLGAGGDLEPGDVGDLLLERAVALDAVPEGLGAHAHDHVVGLAGQHPLAGSLDLGADLLEQALHALVGVHVLVADVDPAEVRGHARGPASSRTRAGRWCWCWGR